MVANAADKRDGQEEAKEGQAGDGLQDVGDGDGDIAESFVAGAEDADADADDDGDEGRDADEFDVVDGGFGDVVKESFENVGVQMSSPENAVRQ
jgi:hypothetical protein